MTEATVKIVCGAPGCNRVLKLMTEAQFPPEGHPYWTDPSHPEWVRPCPKHGGIARTLDEENEYRAAKGLPPIVDNLVGRLSIPVLYSDLRPKYLEAKREGVSFFELVPAPGRL